MNAPTDPFLAKLPPVTLGGVFPRPQVGKGELLLSGLKAAGVFILTSFIALSGLSLLFNIKAQSLTPEQVRHFFKKPSSVTLPYSALESVQGTGLWAKVAQWIGRRPAGEMDPVELAFLATFSGDQPGQPVQGAVRKSIPEMHPGQSK